MKSQYSREVISHLEGQATVERTWRGDCWGPGAEAPDCHPGPLVSWVMAELGEGEGPRAIFRAHDGLHTSAPTCPLCQCSRAGL